MPAGRALSRRSRQSASPTSFPGDGDALGRRADPEGDQVSGCRPGQVSFPLRCSYLVQARLSYKAKELRFRDPLA